MKLLRQSGCPKADKLDCGENAKCMSSQAAEEFHDTCAKAVEIEIQLGRFVSALVEGETTKISVT